MVCGTQELMGKNMARETLDRKTRRCFGVKACVQCKVSLIHGGWHRKKKKRRWATGRDPHDLDAFHPF